MFQIKLLIQNSRETDEITSLMDDLLLSVDDLCSLFTELVVGYLGNQSCVALVKPMALSFCQKTKKQDMIYKLKESILECDHDDFDFEALLKVHAGNLDKKVDKNKSFKNIYIFGFSRPC